MSSPKANPTTRSADVQDLELFTTSATDPAPDRHPSILRPGGHASPLKYPTALRPGAGRHIRTPSPNAHPRLSPQQSPYSPPPQVAYKAYSPPRVQSPSDELSAEIEGYFTALEVAPLNIKKQGAAPETSSATAVAAPALPPKEETPVAADDLYRRCASPPVPPKERIEEERHVVSPMMELEAPVERLQDAGVVSPVSEPEVRIDEGGPSTEPPPAYEESARVTPPPEKAVQRRQSRDESLAGSAAASAARVGSSVVGVDANEAIQASSSNLADSTVEPPAAAAVPPPLPPRQKPSSKDQGAKPAKPAAQPYKAGGAAATSAANVGAAVAGVGKSEGLQQARKALEKGLGHLIDKAKEHHQHLHQHHQHKKEQQHGHARKTSGVKGQKKETSPPRGGADDPHLAMKAEGDYLYV